MNKPSEPNNLSLILADLCFRNWYLEERQYGQSREDYATAVAAKMWRGAAQKDVREAERAAWVESLNRAEQWHTLGYRIQFTGWFQLPEPVELPETALAWAEDSNGNAHRNYYLIRIRGIDG